MIICKTCGDEKDDSEFYWRSTGRLSTPDCKACVSEKRRQYYNDHKLKIRARIARYRLENPMAVRLTAQRYEEKHRERRREYARQYRKTDTGKQAGRNKDRMRRAQKKDTYDGYRDIDIFERDGWTCWLCCKAIDATLKNPDPMCASIDHVILLSRGGPDNRGNVKASHLICNIKRSRK